VLRYGLIVMAVGVLAWHEVVLWNLPDTPEPFDLVKFGTVEVSDADNAMVAYREVFARFGEPRKHQYGLPFVWSAATPEVRRWVDDYRPAIEAWVSANDRPDALLVQPRELRMTTSLDLSQTARIYVRLALLEGSRLEESGDLAGAWRMYRSVLRGSRHVGRHGGTIQRLRGSFLLGQARPRIEAWIGRPGMTPELLRRAMADVETCRAMTSPASETVRAEYFSARDAVNDVAAWSKLGAGTTGPFSDTEWTNQFAAGRWLRRFLRNEPERSARILRLNCAGYLAQCDRPPARRPPMLFPQWMIYNQNAATPEALRLIAPGALAAWADDSVLRDLIRITNNSGALPGTEPRRQT
jgi:hypothetical protein